VKPLPSEGRPKSFSGAVGQFKFTAEGSPANVKIGDPVTMKLTLTGRGNFDRVEAPPLLDPDGWHAYPPSAKFQSHDEVSLSGTKTFELAVVPEKAHPRMPQFEFSYFDPTTEKYVALTTDPQPLRVEGAPPPPPAPVVAPTAAEAPPADQAAAGKSKPDEGADILGLRYDPGRRVDTFTPIYLRREFLILQAIPLLALVLFGVWRAFRRDEHAARIAATEREKHALWRRLQDCSDEVEFFETAVRWLQLEAGIGTDRDPRSIDADAARKSRKLDPGTAEMLDEVFAARTELLYAGVGGGRGTIGRDTRERILSGLSRFERGRNHVG
jgi:hypothetical protein